MTELNSRTRLLLDRAREAATPCAADRLRVRAALRARLAPGPQAGAAGPAVAKLALVAAVAGAALVGALRLDTPRDVAPSARVGPASASPAPASLAPTLPPPPPTVSELRVEARPVPSPADRVVPAPAARQRAARAAPAPVEPARRLRAAPHVPAPPPPAPPEADPLPATPPAPASLPRPPSIAEELRVVSSAQSTLRSNPVASLRLTDEWAVRFPRGALREEALAVRILALCALGRSAEARDLTAQLLAGYPLTTYAPRVRQACARR